MALFTITAVETAAAFHWSRLIEERSTIHLRQTLDTIRWL